MDTVTTLAAGMLTCAPEHILSWPYLHEDWDAALVAQIGGGLAAAAPGFRLDLQSSASAELEAAFKETFRVRPAAHACVLAEAASVADMHGGLMRAGHAHLAGSSSLLGSCSAHFWAHGAMHPSRGGAAEVPCR